METYSKIKELNGVGTFLGMISVGNFIVTLVLLFLVQQNVMACWAIAILSALLLLMLFNKIDYIDTKIQNLEYVLEDELININ